MTVGEFLKQATDLLAKAEVESARLDVLVLLEDTLDKNRANLLAHPEIELSPVQIAKLNSFIAQRQTHVPLAYIRGKAAFYGRDFVVNEHVLVPRPETESLIELAKALPISAPRIADIGCGSGCMAITAALEIPGAAVFAYDIDPEVLNVARLNVQRLKANVQLAQSDLLKNITEQFDVILANLPYVPDEYPINQAAGFEPQLALFAGTDGLDLYRIMFGQLHDRTVSFVITEALIEQHSALADIAAAAGYRLETTDGLAQLFERR